MSSGSGGGAWVSSLGNTFGADTTPPTASAFGNPFASASMAAVTTATAPSQIGTKEDKNSMMTAFSDMGLALAESSSTSAPSSSKALLAKKENERLDEQRAEDERRARRQAAARQKTSQQEAKPASALMQALDAFAGEVSQSDTFTAALHSRNGATTGGASAFSAGSRRARQKAEKAVARGGKSVRDIKRHQRRDRHVY